MNLAALRPVDATPGAIRAAIAACGRERAAASAAIQQLRQERQDMLLEGTARDIVAVDGRIRELEAWSAQIDAVEPLLEAKLAPAIGLEAQEAMRADMAAAMAAAAEFQRWMASKYPALCKPFQEGLELEQRALKLWHAATDRLLAWKDRPELEAAGGVPRGLFMQFPQVVGTFAGSVHLPKFERSERGQ